MLGVVVVVVIVVVRVGLVVVGSMASYPEDMSDTIIGGVLDQGCITIPNVFMRGRFDIPHIHPRLEKVLQNAANFAVSIR